MLSDHPTESLTSYAALIAWARPIGLLSDRTAQQLLRAADQHPDRGRPHPRSRGGAARSDLSHLRGGGTRDRRLQPMINPS